MAMTLYINGRFAAQRLSGVQRFATEITASLRQIGGDRVRVLLPPNAAPDFGYGDIVGRRTGQLWEQSELPRFGRTGILLNLGNTAPVIAGRQIVVIHDAGVFSTPEAYSWKFRLWYKILQYLLVKRGAHIVTVSEFSRRELIQYLPLAADEIAVIPEGADHMARLTADEDVLRRHGLQPGQYVFVVGTLAAHKNIAALGPLADRLAARGMVLAVSGGFGAAVFQGAGTAALPAAARYLDRVSDAALKALYEHAACYVLPSRYEGFGLPAVEAMACGCPVVAADIPALRETCGQAASFCNPLNPEDIADKVLALIDAPDRRDALRAQGLAYVQTKTWTRAASSLYAAIESRFAI